MQFCKRKRKVTKHGASAFLQNNKAKHHTKKVGGFKQVEKSYPLVNSHSNRISPVSIGNISSKGPFSIAMLDYRSVVKIDRLDHLWTVPQVEVKQNHRNHHLAFIHSRVK